METLSHPSLEDIRKGDRFQWRNDASFVWQVLLSQNTNEMFHSVCIVGDDRWERGEETAWCFDESNWEYLGNFTNINP